MMAMMEEQIALKDGSIAIVSFLSPADRADELLVFVNRLVQEKAKITHDRKLNLKEEIAWKKDQLGNQRRKTGYLLIARVDGEIAGTSGAQRDRGKADGNICLGLAISQKYRRLGLGEALLRMNIAVAKRFFKPRPRNIYLSVLANNKPARELYRKLGFREFAVFPKWILHDGMLVDHIMMILDSRVRMK